MSASARTNYRAKHGKKKLGPPFVQLYYHLLDSEGWHRLSPMARAAYIELARLYDGLNNGRLAMSARRLAALLPCNNDTPARALTELDDQGFIAVEKLGSFTRKERHSSEYRLTCYRSDVTGEPPTKDFRPSNRWRSQSEKSGQMGPKNSDRQTEGSSSVRKSRTVGAILDPILRPKNSDTYRLSTIGDSASVARAKRAPEERRSERARLSEQGSFQKTSGTEHPMEAGGSLPHAMCSQSSSEREAERAIV